tara:strand:+ start:175 stop:447 length:273 start_codon:yes stop_codon:yes gene_type:complete
MYTSNREYKNRYGDKYEFVGTDSPSRFILEGDLTHCRFGGKEGVEGLNNLDLGMIDPSGGPYIDLSTLIDNKKITKISVYSEVIMLETEE